MLCCANRPDHVLQRSGRRGHGNSRGVRTDAMQCAGVIVDACLDLLDLRRRYRLSTKQQRVQRGEIISVTAIEFGDLGGGRLQIGCGLGVEGYGSIRNERR